MFIKHVITAGALALALTAAPVAAQTSGSQQPPASGTATGTQQQPATGAQTADQAGQTGSQPSGGNQQEIRQHLSAAREALAELTKLPAAAQLQGEQRTEVANLIANFNTFATASTDWREKYETVDRDLDQLLDAYGDGAAAGTAGVSPAEGAAPAGEQGAPASVGTAGEGEMLDPTIVAKLREVREHLNAFEISSGDPAFIAERIEQILNRAAGAGQGAAGAGATAVTLDPSQVSEIRTYLDRIREVAKR